MATRVRTARLRSRLRRMVEELPKAADSAAFTSAQIAIERAHQHAADSGWAVNNEQVGFDFGLWMENTRNVEYVDEHWAIFNVRRMGTYEDFERIRQPARSGISREDMLWHTGMRMNDSFRRLIMDRPANRQALAEARREVWGDTTPQWWLLNYGNQGTGAANPKDGSFSIEQGGWEVAVDMDDIVSRTVNAHLRREGLLV